MLCHILIRRVLKNAAQKIRGVTHYPACFSRFVEYASALTK